MSSLIKGWSENSFLILRAEKCVTFINAESVDRPLKKILLCLSILVDEQYMSFLVCGSHHFIASLLLV